MTDVTIPGQLEALFNKTELENMRALRGWATGTAALIGEDGAEKETYEDCWIELLNGDGKAGRFTGVRFHHVDTSVEYDPEEPWADDGLTKGYAYGREAAATDAEPPYVVITDYDQEDIDIGPATPP